MKNALLRLHGYLKMLEWGEKMDFPSIVEYAKNGSDMPKISSQSEQLAYSTITEILGSWKLGLVTSHCALEEKKRAERLFEEAKLEEKRRREILRAYQQNLIKVEHQIHIVNHMIQIKDSDKDAIIRELISIVEELTGTRIKIREE